MVDRNLVLAYGFGTVGMLQIIGKVWPVEDKLLTKVNEEYQKNPSEENYARLNKLLNKISDRVMHK